MIGRMTDETSNPKRKRRRWIIVGVLLFVAGIAGAAGWWNSSRVDQRFVGTWESSVRRERFILESDGRCFHGLRGERHPGRFVVVKDVLYLLPPRRTGLGGLQQIWMELMDRLKERPPSDQSFQVKEVSAQQLVLGIVHRNERFQYTAYETYVRIDP